jgi:catechol 2,3-dioxygenase-like lactoylglutathione lyase family enzyme
MMKLGHIELFVRDPLASRDFYRDVLGFKVIAEQQGKFVWVALGDREILLRPGTVAAPVVARYQDAASAIVLYVDDVSAEAKRLRSRGLMFRGDDGSVDCPTFTDPDGHWFQLVNPAHP